MYQFVTKKHRDILCAAVFSSGGAGFDFTAGTCSDRCQMIGDDSRPSCLIPLGQQAELREGSSSSHSPPSAVLEESLHRAGPGLERAQNTALPVPPTPRASSEVVGPTPLWHLSRPSAGITAENSSPIHHGSLLVTFVLFEHFLNFEITSRVT